LQDKLKKEIGGLDLEVKDKNSYGFLSLVKRRENVAVLEGGAEETMNEHIKKIEILESKNKELEEELSELKCKQKTEGEEYLKLINGLLEDESKVKKLEAEASNLREDYNILKKEKTFVENENEELKKQVEKLNQKNLAHDEKKHSEVNLYK